jgi:heat shock protein HslJ
MKHFHHIRFFLLLLTFVSLTACSTNSTSNTLPGTTGFRSTSWELQTYGQPNNEQQVLSGTTITAEFDQRTGIVSGSAGCNSYSAGYTLNGFNLSVTNEIMSTMMACSEEIMQQEQMYLKILQAAERYQLQDNILIIMSAGNQTLTFISR